VNAGSPLHEPLAAVTAAPTFGSVLVVGTEAFTGASVQLPMLTFAIRVVQFQPPEPDMYSPMNHAVQSSAGSNDAEK
jgi:hypothetical protein